jgi:hypothetical protein
MVKKNKDALNYHHSKIKDSLVIITEIYKPWNFEIEAKTIVQSTANDEPVSLTKFSC